MALGSSFVKEALINRAELPDLEVPADNDPFGVERLTIDLDVPRPRGFRVNPIPEPRPDARTPFFARDPVAPPDPFPAQPRNIDTGIRTNATRPMFVWDGVTTGHRVTDVRDIPIPAEHPNVWRNELWISDFRWPDGWIRSNVSHVIVPPVLREAYEELSGQAMDAPRGAAGDRARAAKAAAAADLDLWLYFKREGMIR
jgi:hypothetical protein